MFRRRRGRHRIDSADESHVDAPNEEEDDAAPVPEGRSEGPWDAGEAAPAMDRVDLGALRIPVGHDLEVQVNLAGDQIVSATVLQGSSALQLLALAAPKTSGIWDDVRREVARELQRTGGSAEETEGVFGAELRARVPTETHGGRTVPRPARIVGVDGPRWLLRGVFTGQAAEDRGSARRLEEVFRAVVVVRGDAPLPPRELLDLQLPPEMREADARAAQAEDQPVLDPFRRGPEITETR